MKILTNRRNKNAIRGPRTKMQKSCSTEHLLMTTSKTFNTKFTRSFIRAETLPKVTPSDNAKI